MITITNKKENPVETIIIMGQWSLITIKKEMCSWGIHRISYRTLLKLGLNVDKEEIESIDVITARGRRSDCKFDYMSRGVKIFPEFP